MLRYKHTSEINHFIKYKIKTSERVAKRVVLDIDEHARPRRCTVFVILYALGARSFRFPIVLISLLVVLVLENADRGR